MAKLQTVISAPVDSKGRPQDLDARTAAREVGESTSYAPVAPATYDAVVKSVELASYRGRATPANPNSEDGKWEYHKIIPDITLLNENGTQISRQDFTIGIMDNGKFIRPDGKAQSPIWMQGQWLLTALGCFKASETNPMDFTLDLDDETIADQLIRVKTGLAGYIKEPKLAFDVAKLNSLLTSLNDGKKEYTFADVSVLVDKFNAMTVEELAKLSAIGQANAEAIIANRASGDGILKIKNVIVAVFAITEEHAKEHGWYYDPTTGAVYVTTQAWIAKKAREALNAQPSQPF